MVIDTRNQYGIHFDQHPATSHFKDQATAFRLGLRRLLPRKRWLLKWIKDRFSPPQGLVYGDSEMVNAHFCQLLHMIGQSQSHWLKYTTEHRAELVLINEE